MYTVHFHTLPEADHFKLRARGRECPSRGRQPTAIHCVCLFYITLFCFCLFIIYVCYFKFTFFKSSDDARILKFMHSSSQHWGYPVALQIISHCYARDEGHLSVEQKHVRKGGLVVVDCQDSDADLPAQGVVAEPLIRREFPCGVYLCGRRGVIRSNPSVANRTLTKLTICLVTPSIHCYVRLLNICYWPKTIEIELLLAQ